MRWQCSAAILLVCLGCSEDAPEAANKTATINLPSYDKKNLRRPDYLLGVQDLARWGWSGITEPKPAEFDKFSANLGNAVDKENWAEAVTWAEKVRDLIPEKTPDDYPSDPDTRAKWSAAVAELMVLADRVEDASALYEKVLAETPKTQQSFARATASYGLAQVRALQGRFPEAKELQDSGGGEFWSGCGNCLESENLRYSHQIHRLGRGGPEQSQALAPLADVMNGMFTRRQNGINGDSSDHQRKATRMLAAFHIGFIYEKAGDPANARKAYELCVASSVQDKVHGFEALYAWERLKHLAP